MLEKKYYQMILDEVPDNEILDYVFDNLYDSIRESVLEDEGQNQEDMRNDLD